MYLSDRDLEFAVKTGQLIVNPEPEEYDTTGIDLHLDSVDQAKTWDMEAFNKNARDAGHDLATVGVGKFNYKAFSTQFHKPVPEEGQGRENSLVFRKGTAIVLRPHGFFLWQTKEEVGTPEDSPRLICFGDGKSTIARTGLIVHLTAPTIHADWWGKITLEIANLGPFNLEFKEGDAIAQIVVAAITSPPIGKKHAKGVAIGQGTVDGHDCGTS